MDAKMRNNRGREFVSEVAGTLSAALSLATGDACSFEVSDIYDLQGKAAAQISIEVSGNLTGGCFIEFYDPLLTDLAARISGQSDIAAKDRGEVLKAAVDSAMKALTETLAGQYGPVEFAVDAVSGLALGEMWMVPLASVDDRSKAAVHIFLDDALLDSLSNAVVAETNSDDAAPVHPANLKLVMDVELNVSLRFGQRQMPLREVLGLASGSVVELDRKVNEPVELLLDGKLVARGEAVIVDGNYGLRVTEIPQSIQSHFLN
jgi:flagellar motor switch protein FliN/FliY